jgi:hypothetical protein
MAAMAMASFPFTNNVSGCCSPTLSPNSDSDIRTDFSTDGTAGTYLIVFPNHKEVSLPVDLFAHPNQFLRARDRAEPATLTTLSINFDFRHYLFR